MSSLSGTLTVVALGGNALLREDQRGSEAEQIEGARRAAVPLVDLASSGGRLLVVHGNGPQVGKELRRVEAAAKEVPPVGLDVCVASTQASMGYFLSRALRERLAEKAIDGEVVVVLTHVLVDPSDPAFHEPTKPVGSAFDAREAERLARDRGWSTIEDVGRGYRRAVPSPRPVRVLEEEVIARLAERGYLVIAGGGGGIPVFRDERGRLEGLEGVIDKDRTASLLGRAVGAERLIHLTSVDAVYLDYSEPTRRPLERLTVSEARKLVHEGQFPAGSMGPKIESSCDFLEGGGKEVLITSADHLPEALAGRGGTRLYP